MRLERGPPPLSPQRRPTYLPRTRPLPHRSPTASPPFRSGPLPPCPIFASRRRRGRLLGGSGRVDGRPGTPGVGSGKDSRCPRRGPASPPPQGPRHGPALGPPAGPPPPRAPVRVAPMQAWVAQDPPWPVAEADGPDTAVAEPAGSGKRRPAPADRARREEAPRLRRPGPPLERPVDAVDGGVRLRLALVEDVATHARDAAWTTAGPPRLPARRTPRESAA